MHCPQLGRRLLLPTALAALAALRCSSAPQVCAPGQQASCACPGGGNGAQVCNIQGSGWDKCLGCETAHPDAGADPGRLDAGPTHPDAGTASRECELHSDCNEAAKEGVCIAAPAGGSSCALKCTGFSGACADAKDCKLAATGVNSETQGNLVPACIPNGTTAPSASCTANASCPAGFTCARNQTDANSSCSELCTPFKASCTDSTQHCAYGLTGYPADWGICRP